MEEVSSMASTDFIGVLGVVTK